MGVPSKDLVDKLHGMKIKVTGHMSVIEDSVADTLRNTVKPEPKKSKKSVPEKAVKSEVKEADRKTKIEPKHDVKATQKQVKPAKKTEVKHEEKPAVKTEIKTQIQKPAVKDTVKPVTAHPAVHKHAKPEPAVNASKPVEKKPVQPPVIQQAPIKAAETPKPAQEVQPKILEIEYPITVKQLSVKLGLKVNNIIMKLLSKNILANINQNLEEAVAEDIARLYGYEIRKAKTLEEQLIKEEDEHGSKGVLKQRHPVVTFMGHVDHGKTSLLDYIRKTKVAAKEKGGITQHIGAYKVNLPKGSVTFLDTPGHEAFTAMRARGANITDLVVLVVAANDGVMPQTREAIDHARAAGVTLVVAINKCDLPDISIDKVKRQLSEYNLMPEDWGGKTIMVPVSAKTGQGVDNLLEMLLLEAELLELKANPSLRARGVVIEAKLSPGKGVIANILVRNGTLKIGDIILCGMYYGKIKAMINDRGERVAEAGPATPVEVLGLQGVPSAGDEFFSVKDEKKARTLSTLKQEENRHKGLRSTQRVSLESLYARIKEGEVKELKIILKADVQGSIEALNKSLESLSTDEVKVNLVHLGVGNVNESDVNLAVVTNAIIIGFNVKIDPQADEIAKKENIEISKYDIIYNAINDVKAGLEGLLEPIEKETFQGRAKVQQVFRVTKVGTVAGSIVVKGTIARANPVKLIRANTEVYRGKIRNLKRFKDDVRDVSEGAECGIALENFTDIRSGDLIESFSIEKIARRLDSRR